MIWHSASASEVLENLDVNDKIGLANGVVDMRAEKYGYNVVSTVEKPSFFSCFLNQLKSKIVVILIITAILSFFVSMFYEQVNSFSSLLIIAIVVINALISGYHVFSSNNTLDSIKTIKNPSVKVLREGILKTVNSIDLVPGDIIILEAGDYISADARIIESNEFRCDESTITGEEVPVEKNGNLTVDDITPIERRGNMVFSGCSVIHGSAKAVVVSTGINTEVGKSSAILQLNGDNNLPFKVQIDYIGKIANIFIFIACVAFFVIGMIQNFSSGNFADMTLKMLVNTLALAVAAIPEGLPIISSIVIAIGVQRMVKDKIIVKDTSALEFLGKTNVIISDKTGILTSNKMVLSKIFDGNKITDVESEQPNEKNLMVIKLATACSTLNNDSTEDAIKNACLTYNSMSITDIENIFPILSVVPFDSERKTMSVITMINEKPFAIVKGAPEIVVPKCVGCDNDMILKVNEYLANDAYRIVCIAIKPLEAIPTNPNSAEIEQDLVFAGLIGLTNPIREKVISDIAECDNAGIRTVMITGDNLITAKSIARRIGILKDGTEAITGEQLNELTDEQLYNNIDKYSVFARISPTDKIRIVRAWQNKKAVVTITGDSIYDANSLATADVGCAMGKFGTDVAKGNADIVISDNHFNSIVGAIKESRGLFENIKKSILYLLSCNLAEILTIIVGISVFSGSPLAAVQLLWINMLTDCAPVIALTMDNSDSSIMSNKNFVSFGKIFDLTTVFTLLLQSVFITGMTLVSYSLGYNFGVSKAMTMAFATLSLAEIFYCFNNKFDGTIFNSKLFSNRFMNLSTILTVFIIIFLLFTPAGYVFGLEILTVKQFLAALFLSFLIIPFGEILKFIKKITDN